MPYAPFHERFPELAEEETRTLIIFNDPVLPSDEYGLIEMYCDEPGCDCRRVMFNVASWRTGKTLAVIAYGWESKAFYRKWYRYDEPENIIKELQGPVLNSMSPQSKLAPALLEKVTRFALQDQKYVNRLKRHYQMFRDAIEQEENEENEEEILLSRVRQYSSEFRAKSKKENESSEPCTPVSKTKIGRNAPCPCGSGKKYKKCCVKEA